MDSLCASNGRPPSDSTTLCETLKRADRQTDTAQLAEKDGIPSLALGPNGPIRDGYIIAQGMAHACIDSRSCSSSDRRAMYSCSDSIDSDQPRSRIAHLCKRTNPRAASKHALTAFARSHRRRPNPFDGGGGVVV